jgi:hypothetical protein
MITARRPLFRPRQAHTGAVYMGEAPPRAVQPPLRKGPIAIRTTAAATTGDASWARRAATGRD